MRVAALVLGAGRGERLGHDLPKAFVPLAGRPLIAHALATLCACPSIDTVLPVVPASQQGDPALAGHPKLAPAVAGGDSRQDSLAAGLAALADDVGWVAVHDAARPRVRPEAVERVVAAARETGAALLAVPLTDTVKRVRAGRVVETPPRDELWAAQTPQVFRVDWLREGLAKARAEGRLATDCSQLVEALGVEVAIVPGDADNAKVTSAADLARAERALAGEPAP